MWRNNKFSSYDKCISKCGIQAVPLTGGQAGIITNDKFTEAQFTETHPELILSIVKQGKVPIVTGFQGVTEKGYFTTLGRGGSDTSACILGIALKAEAVEIYTDVDGIMTADPRIVNNASLIDVISYNEVFQLAIIKDKSNSSKGHRISKKGKYTISY